MATLGSGLPDHVGDDEDLARYLTQSSQFNAIMAKPSAFLPSPRDRETSVSRHGSDPLDGLWALGVEAAGPRNLHGAAIVKARAVREVHLHAEADEPPPRHAAIRGWPWDEADPELQKAKQKEMALVIASQAVLVRK
jgi:hypothetical protein